MAKVTILEKKGGKWSKQEKETLIEADVVIESRGSLPERMVATNKPLDGRTFQQVLGCNNFEEREVDSADRWK